MKGQRRRPPRPLPWHGISDQEARRQRRAMARDRCKCDHVRQEHEGPYGRVMGCNVPKCPCQAYAFTPLLEQVLR